MTDNTPSISPKKTAILILGMHRSGTSALTRVISLLGADLPCNLEVGCHDNQTGHWESRDIFEFNEKILLRLGSNWNKWSETDFYSIGPSEQQLFKDQATQLLLRDFSESNLFVLKDPRMCLLLPFWLDVLNSIGAQTKCVIITRNPLEVAASLKKRDHFNETKSTLLWLQYTLRAEEKTRSLDRIFVSYQNLLNNWQPELKRIGQELAIHWPRWSKDSEININSFLDPRHKHHTTQDQSIFANPKIANWVKNTYSALTALQRSSIDSKSLNTLDTTRHELLKAHQLLGKHLLTLENQVAENQLQLQELENNIAHQKHNYSLLEQNYIFLEQELTTKTDQIANLVVQLKSSLDEKLIMSGVKNKTLFRLNSLQSLELWKIFNPIIKLELAQPKWTKFLISSMQLTWWAVSFTLPKKLHTRRLVNEYITNGLFDISWYIEHNPDVVLQGQNIIYHWFTEGWKEGRLPNPYFDPNWYVQKYPEVTNTNINPLVHYYTTGFKNGLDPSPYFNTQLYFVENQDDDSQQLNPLAHYLTIGRKKNYKVQASRFAD